jgi:hypothetical protein
VPVSRHGALAFSACELQSTSCAAAQISDP